MAAESYRSATGGAVVRFPLGRLVITRGALDLAGCGLFNPAEILSRHATGDWGDLCNEDKRLNEDDLENGGRLLSAYELAGESQASPADHKLYVITEWDRSVTTILLAEEY